MDLISADSRSKFLALKQRVYIEQKATECLPNYLHMMYCTLTDVLLRLIVRDRVLNWWPVLRGAVLGLAYFVWSRSGRVGFLYLARGLGVVRLVHVKVSLWLLFEDHGHSLAARFVGIRCGDVLLFEGNAPAHATFRLGIAVEAMNFGLQFVQLLVVRRTWDHFLVLKHLSSSGDALSLGDHIIRFLSKQLAARAFRAFSPISYVRILLRVNYWSCSFLNINHVARRTALDTKFAHFESIFDFILMVAHGKIVLTSYRIKCYNALRSANVILFKFTTS